MESLDRILDGFTDPSTGSLHGAVFIVVDRSGTNIISDLDSAYISLMILV
jgi:hypothetical protein